MMTLEDFEFFLAVCNFGTALLAAVIIAWSRHEPQPKAEQALDPTRVVQFVYQLDRDYTAIRERDDPLPDDDKAILRRMIEDGAPLTFRMAASYGIKRAGWNRLRAALAGIGLADTGQCGDLLLTPAALEYLRVPNE